MTALHGSAIVFRTSASLNTQATSTSLSPAHERHNNSRGNQISPSYLLGTQRSVTLEEHQHTVANKENDPNSSITYNEDDIDEFNDSRDDINMSSLSLNPIRNLMNTFERLDLTIDHGEALLRSPQDGFDQKTAKMEKKSPNGVVDLDLDDNKGMHKQQLSMSDMSNYQFDSRSMQPLKSPGDNKQTTTVSLISREEKSYLSYLSPAPLTVPRFHLHSKLQMYLTQPVVDRCSLYSVIHDVNKEIQDMAQYDKPSLCRPFLCPVPVEDDGPQCPLVIAVQGPKALSSSLSMNASNNQNENSFVPLAMIDEEMFLLRVISSRTKNEMTIRACPASFAEAIGEVEPGCSTGLQSTQRQKPSGSENPLSLLVSSRTQLWKPGRSWWEAKSGKNPWIEATSHNKRWRYLWPLIHYHKFLAKCIKKLKRNNIDVKSSLSPVASFLREEVCAVSDHLALVSRFTSEEWMEALGYFDGWTDQSTECQENLRVLVGNLSLRHFSDSSDVDSALLRSQIDESFLRAMAASKALLVSGKTPDTPFVEAPSNSVSHVPTEVDSSLESKTSNQTASFNNSQLPPSGKNMKQSRMNGGNHVLKQPRRIIYPQSEEYKINQGYQVNEGVWIHPPYINGPSSALVTTPYVMYPPLSSNFNGYSEPAHPGNQYFHPSFGFSYPYYSDMIMMPHPYYTGYEGSNFPASEYDDTINVQQISYPGDSAPVNIRSTRADPGPMTNCHSDDFDFSFQSDVDVQLPNNDIFHSVQTPYKENNLRDAKIQLSPYWAHLDRGTLALAGIATPHGGYPSPATPRKIIDGSEHDFCMHSGMIGAKFIAARSAKPLFINPSTQYTYSWTGAVTAIPPSPATQFMMSNHPGSCYNTVMGQHESSINLRPDGSIHTNQPSPPTSSPEGTSFTN